MGNSCVDAVAPENGPLIAIVGPTAAGKTALAATLAQRFGGEVIGADSRQIYRGMDAGTAKPSAAERACAPHHLIDIIEPDAPFGLAQYLELAREATRAVRERGRIPFLVGGTGQYVWAVLEGWQPPQAPPNEALRRALEGRAEREGPAVLYNELERQDPVAAAAIVPRNVRRVIRALEIIATTGRRASELRTRRIPPPESIILGLNCPREQLYRRIDERVEAMFAGGLLEEVETLLARGYAPKLPSLSGIGYAQVVRYLGGDISCEIALEQTKNATHRLVRQQGAWFRAADPRIYWLPAGDEGAADVIERRLNRHDRSPRD